MDRVSLPKLLCRSPFHRFLEVDRTGKQLPSFIATALGQKPAMDMWVRAASWGAFEKLASYFGLLHHTDSYFDRHSERDLRAVPQESFTTTRAAFSRELKGRAEAHVFIARTRAALSDAVSAGWYPLVVDGRVVEKHLADHEKFGEALGYPACCREFFRLRNDWFDDNTYYAAYLNTKGPPRMLSNGLLRHTAFYFTPHMPCSFACDMTIAYSRKLRAALAQEAGDYAAEIDRRSASPMLCLSELQIYRFEGRSPSPGRVQYDGVEAVNPTNHLDPLYEMLAQGDACVVDRNIVRVEKRGSQVYSYLARADKHGPEFPFVVECA